MTKKYHSHNDPVTCGRTTYSNPRVAAAMLKVTTNTVYQARLRGTLDTLGTGHAKRRFANNKEIKIGPVTYDNPHACAAALSISVQTVYQARKRNRLDKLGSVRPKRKKQAKAVEACANTPAVIGKTVRKAKPCSLCGTMDNVTITYAVPLDEGGWDSDWNWQILCGKCRQMRHDMAVYQTWRAEVALEVRNGTRRWRETT